MKGTAVRRFLIALAFFLVTATCVASDRDRQADLVVISANFIAMYAATPHKAGDPNGQFIEDVVIPAVNDVVTSDGARLSNAQVRATVGFIVASEPLASEEVSEIAGRLYRAQTAKLCASVARLDRSKRTTVLDRIKSGLAASGKPAPRVICP